MSRIGKQPIALPKGVRTDIQDSRVVVESDKGKLITRLPEGIGCEKKDETLVVTRRNDSRSLRAFHGMVRSHLANAVRGVTEGFRKELDIIGIGYRAKVSGQKVEFQIGYSKPVQFSIPEGLDLKIEKQTRLTLTGVDKQLVGQVAANIRSLRPPEPYKGKGIRYRDEVIRRKAGKAGKTGSTA